MKINRAAHIPWALFVLALSAGAVLLYLAQFHPQRVPTGFRIYGETPPGHATIGGTPLGLVLGTLSFFIFIFAVLLGLRKRLPRLFPGHVQTWLRAHIWLTLLTVPLILLHSGFHLGSPMTTLLMGLYAVVMVSGIYGLILQQKLPAWMKERLPAEIVYEQIPNIRAQLCGAARRLRRAYRPEREDSDALPVRPVLQTAGTSASAASQHPAGAPAISSATLIASEVAEAESVGRMIDSASETLLVEFIELQLLPYLEVRRGEKFRLGRAREAKAIFRHLKLRVASAYHARVDEMEAWCNERRLLDLQTKMQHWLHGWLFVHVPFSFLLLLMTAWHAFVTLFRY